MDGWTRLHVVEQPCVLCEGTLCTDTLWRNPQGEERWDREYQEASHVCEPLLGLIAERGGRSGGTYAF